MVNYVRFCKVRFCVFFGEFGIFLVFYLLDWDFKLFLMWVWGVLVIRCLDVIL